MESYYFSLLRLWDFIYFKWDYEIVAIQNLPILPNQISNKTSVMPDLESILPTSPWFTQGHIRPEHLLQLKDHSKLLSILFPPAIIAGVTEGYFGYTNHTWFIIYFISYKTLQISTPPPLFSACLLWKRILFDQGLSTAKWDLEAVLVS